MRQSYTVSNYFFVSFFNNFVEKTKHCTFFLKRYRLQENDIFLKIQKDNFVVSNTFFCGKNKNIEPKSEGFRKRYL